MATPLSSYWGLPALPIICNKSVAWKSTYLWDLGSKYYVPLIITSRAGKLTPQAKVEVAIIICTLLLTNNYSQIYRSWLSRPAWCITIPKLSVCFKYSSWINSIAFWIISGLHFIYGLFYLNYIWLNDIRSFAVRRVWRRDDTNMITGFPSLNFLIWL